MNEPEGEGMNQLIHVEVDDEKGNNEVKVRGCMR